MITNLLAGLLGTSSILSSFAPFGALIEPFRPIDGYFVPVESQTAHAGKAGTLLKASRPEVRLAKWNGEVELGVSYDLDARASHNESTGITTWDAGGEAVEAYPLVARAGMEDGGFEIEVVLDQVPSSNRFEFPIDGYEDLEFYYQPPLTVENVPAKVSYCTDTKCFDDAGNIIVTRPEEIVGSYAVYHKELKGHVAGQTNYGSGKAFQVFRPKARDAKGNEAWGELSYADGVLAVTMPEEYLASAAYPVRVDPTFGYTSIGASSIACDSSVCFAGALVEQEYRHYAAGQDTLTNIHVYGHADSGTKVLGTAVYDYDPDTFSPEVRQGAVKNITFTTTPGWHDTATFSEVLASGNEYVLAAGDYPETGNITLYYDTVTDATIFDAYPSLNEFWSSSVYDASRFSIYGEYECDPSLTECSEYIEYNPATSGVTTWTSPEGVESATVVCWGGGGGGGDGTNTGGGGGGGGAFAGSIVALTENTDYTFIIGAGGAGAAVGAGNDGTAGGASSFNSNQVVAAGGSRGQGGSSTNPPGGAGGTTAASTGDAENAGGDGGAATNTGDTGGGGGGAGHAYGAGDAGASGDTIVGGDGGSGNVVVGNGMGGSGGNASNGQNGFYNYIGGGGGGGGGGDNGFAGGDGGLYGGGGGGGENGGGDGADGACLIVYQAVAPGPEPLPRHTRLFEGMKLRIIGGKVRIMQEFQ